MNSWIGVSVSLGIFVLSHIVITVWWASKVNVLLNIVQKDLTAIVDELKLYRANTFTKEEIVKELAICEKERAAIWKKLDKTRDGLA